MKRNKADYIGRAFGIPAWRGNLGRAGAACLVAAAVTLFPLRPFAQNGGGVQLSLDAIGPSLIGGIQPSLDAFGDALPAAANDDDGPRFLPNILVSSTIPKNGDLNPYGVAFIPAGFPAGGLLRPGDILVSNFNNKKNLQGTGATIIQLTPSAGASPDGEAKVFFQGRPLGFTLALGVLRRGIVVAGNVTTTDGKSDTVKGGPLLFIDKNGKVILTVASSAAHKLNGPWGLALKDDLGTAKLFVANVLDGTVTRFDLSLPNSETVTASNPTQIASGYKHRTDPAALVLGPAGLFYDPGTDILYVASTADNAIFAVPHAASAGATSGTGKAVFKDSHLRGPLALALAPNGDLLTSNGDAVNADPAQPSEIVEFTKGGKFIGQYNIHQNQGGAFGVATSQTGTTGNLAVVNDNANDVAVTAIPLD